MSRYARDYAGTTCARQRGMGRPSGMSRPSIDNYSGDLVGAFDDHWRGQSKEARRSHEHRHRIDLELVHQVESVSRKPLLLSSVGRLSPGLRALVFQSGDGLQMMDHLMHQYGNLSGGTSPFLLQVDRPVGAIIDVDDAGTLLWRTLQRPAVCFQVAEAQRSHPCLGNQFHPRVVTGCRQIKV